MSTTTYILNRYLLCDGFGGQKLVQHPFQISKTVSSEHMRQAAYFEICWNHGMAVKEKHVRK